MRFLVLTYSKTNLRLGAGFAGRWDRLLRRAPQYDP